MEKRIEFKFLKEQSLLKNLTDEQIMKLTEQFLEEKFLPGDIILSEGDETRDMYLIREGEVDVLKWDEEHKQQIVIGRLGKGDIFGEMSFMDISPRSSGIKVVKPTTVLKLSRETLFGDMQDVELKILTNIAMVNINRLRDSNKTHVKNFEELQKLYQTRQGKGKFLLYQYLILGLCFSIAWLIKDPINIYLPWIMAIMPSFLLIPFIGYEWPDFGFDWKKKQSLITIGLAAFLIIGFSAFKPFLLFFSLYCLCYEVISRSILQNAFQEFFRDFQGFKAILLNAGFIFIFIFPFNYQLAFIATLINLVFGFIYAKQKSLITVFLLHFLLIALGITHI